MPPGGEYRPHHPRITPSVSGWPIGPNQSRDDGLSFGCGQIESASVVRCTGDSGAPCRPESCFVGFFSGGGGGGGGGVRRQNLTTR